MQSHATSLRSSFPDRLQRRTYAELHCCVLCQVAHSPYSGVSHCIRVMLKEEGAGAFFKSLRTTVRSLVGSSICKTISCDAALHVWRDCMRSTALLHHRSAVDPACKLEEGAKPHEVHILRAAAPQILMNVPFTAIHFSAYEAGKRALGEAGQPEGLRSELLAGGLAGALHPSFLLNPLRRSPWSHAVPVCARKRHRWCAALFSSFDALFRAVAVSAWQLLDGALVLVCALLR